MVTRTARRRTRWAVVLLAALIAGACVYFSAIAAWRYAREMRLARALRDGTLSLSAASARLDEPGIRDALRRFAHSDEFAELLRRDIASIVEEAASSKGLGVPWKAVRWGVLWATERGVHGYVEIGDATGIFPLWIDGYEFETELIKPDLGTVFLGGAWTLEDGARLENARLEEAAAAFGLGVHFDDGIPSRVVHPALRADADSWTRWSSRRSERFTAPANGESFVAWTVKRP